MKNEETKPLTSEEWANHHNYRHADGLVRNVKNRAYSVQTIEMLKIAGAGKKVLEIGSGSGETSLALQSAQNHAVALDFTQSCLDLTKIAAAELNLEVKTVLADATIDLPFEADQFDIAFQAGLLEHFERDKRIELLQIWGKNCKTMVSIIPNAASIGYRFGMQRLKKKGEWSYGLELPQFSLQEEFREAGFKVVSEYTIGEHAALNFLPRWHPLRLGLRIWLRFNITGDNCHQGYLLVTIGEKIE